MIFALIGAIVAEFVGAESGLGMLIQSMNFTMDVAGQFSVLLILSASALLLNGLVTAVRRRVLFWDASREGGRGPEGEAVAEPRSPHPGGRGKHRMRSLVALLLAVAWLVSLLLRRPRAQTTKLRVGWCAKTVTSAAAPFAIATKMGWFEQEGIKVQLVPLPGSTDCVKTVATKEVDYSLPSIEPLAIIRPQGVKALISTRRTRATFTASSCRRIRRSRNSPTSRARRIGVTSMASAGVIIARALPRPPA